MKLVILDRDGVINRDSPDYIKHPDEWVPLPGSLGAIAALCRGGYRVAVATNQSGIARGLYSQEILCQIHAKMCAAVAQAGGEIALICHCASADDRHPQRKPNPGMLYQIADHFGVSLDGVPCIGDSLRDIVAAKRAGAMPLLVQTGNGAAALAALQPSPPPVFVDLSAAANHLLGYSPPPHLHDLLTHPITP